MNYIKTNHLSLLIIAFLVLSSFFGSPKNLGATDPTTFTNPIKFASTISIGSGGTAGTAISKLYKGTCSLIAPSFTVAASTTVSMDCAVTGAVSGDVVFAQFATSTAVFGGWQVGSASASSTSGYITLRVNNWSGVSATMPASIASSTQYLIIR